MLINDKQLGTPQVLYKNTKAAIEALAGIDEGAHAYVTDTISNRRGLVVCVFRGYI